MRTGLVVATADTEPGDAADRLLHLVVWLRRQGIDVEIVALGDGAALRRFRSAAPTTVVDRLRRRGPAIVPYALGMNRAAAAIKSFRLRRWLRRRSHMAFFVHDPLAASLLRYMSHPPPRVVAGLPDATASLEAVRPQDRSSLRDAVGWVVATPAQVDEVSGTLGQPTEILGSMVDRSLPPVRTGPDARTVVVLVSADLWDWPDHATELSWQLLRQRPGTPLRWLVQGRDAAWLCHHDLDHVGLTGGVTICSSDHPDALDDAAVVVRAGHRPERDDLLVAAALAGVPVVDWAGGELLGPPDVGPLDVEQAVGSVAAMLDDPGARAGAVSARIARLTEVDVDRMGHKLLQLLLGDTG